MSKLFDGLPWVWFFFFFSWLQCYPDFSSCPTVSLTFWGFIKLSRQLLDGLLWNLVNAFMVPRGWFIITVISQAFIYLAQSGQNFILSNTFVDAQICTKSHDISIIFSCALWRVLISKCWWSAANGNRHCLAAVFVTRFNYPVCWNKRLRNGWYAIPALSLYFWLWVL